jgi:hypothetical protein
MIFNSLSEALGLSIKPTIALAWDPAKIYKRALIASEIGNISGALATLYIDKKYTQKYAKNNLKKRLLIDALAFLPISTLIKSGVFKAQGGFGFGSKRRSKRRSKKSTYIKKHSRSVKRSRRSRRRA